MIKFDILNRFSGAVQFTAEINCSENEAKSIKVGLAVKWALKGGANLGGANLGDAYLRGANLGGANHISDRVIDGGLRSDGYRFLLTRTEPGKWRIKAGCRNFTVDDGLNHWAETRPEGEPLGDETRLIVAHMVALAKLRAWPETGEEPKAEAV